MKRTIHWLISLTAVAGLMAVTGCISGRVTVAAAIRYTQP
jgi:hypothetical protein